MLKEKTMFEQAVSNVVEGKQQQEDCKSKFQYVWKDFFNRYKNATDDEMSYAFSLAQSKITDLFPNGVIMRDLLPSSVIDYIYNLSSKGGFEKDPLTDKYYNPKYVTLAKKVLRILACSPVSNGCKSTLNIIARAYGLPRSDKYKIMGNKVPSPQIEASVHKKYK